MERNGHVQLELFTQGNKPAPVKTEREHRFLSSIRRYEKIILFIIGFFVTGLISFSLGVEKGKGMAAPPKNSANLDLANVVKPEPEAPPKMPAQLQNYYTIQIASYRTNSSAQKEAEGLRKKGFSAAIIAKGDYNIVCVGNFPDREKARPSLSELKKRYDDCFIRRI
jgi:hypothetical protein